MRKYELFLEDILSSIKKIERYSLHDLKKDDMAFDAILRNLETIGEAVKSISPELKEEYKDIEWKRIIGIRDIITHAYFGIDKDIILEIISNKLPRLKRVVIELIKKEKDSSTK